MTVQGYPAQDIEEDEQSIMVSLYTLYSNYTKIALFLSLVGRFLL
jgi:hypothetical protein